MGKRRTLDDGLTPDEEQFLHATSSLEGPKLKESVDEPETPREVAQITATEVGAFGQHPLGMIGLNTRVAPHISAALLRASVDRKIERRARAAVQDIVNEALTDWLTKAGYIT